VVQAQKNEFGLEGGAAGYLGDINKNELFSFSGSSFRFFYRYNKNNRISYSLGYSTGTIRASDSKYGTSENQIERNLDFTSQINEISGLMEINYFPYVSGNMSKKFTPYLFYGITLFQFSSTTELDGVEYKLRSVGTEGQGLAGGEKAYAPFGIAIPFGLGTRLRLGKQYNLNTSFGYRFTSSDYIDDIGGDYPDLNQLQEEKGEFAGTLSDRSTDGFDKSFTQRGDDTNLDKYFFLTIGISYTINPYRCPQFF
jgi:hypothetical protein